LQPPYKKLIRVGRRHYSSILYFLFLFSPPYRASYSYEIIPFVVTFRFPVIGFTGPTQYIMPRARKSTIRKYFIRVPCPHICAVYVYIYNIYIVCRGTENNLNENILFNMVQHARIVYYVYMCVCVVASDGEYTSFNV